MFDSTKRYELTIRPLGRKPADEYYHNGSIWIEGREGNNYTIDLTNRSNHRALFILSVDGLDVLEGKTAGLNSQGYIIAGGQTISVPGWKINNNQAAVFYFSRSRDSYVNSIGGSTTNTGVSRIPGATARIYRRCNCIPKQWASRCTSIEPSPTIVGS